MKKNTMMRLASALLVLVLLTTCAISGTFAKYVTEIAEASDTARVAKWGVNGTITGEAFATTYDLDDDEVEGEFTLAVESSTQDKLVAPGTTGTFTGIRLTGTPETAVRIATVADLDLGDKWVDAEGEYYCPIVITINGTAISGLTQTDAAAFELAVENAIKAANGDYEPNTNLANISTLNGAYTWAWAFEGNDVNDTFLGDEAAAERAATITLTVSTTVTQID